jgi:hypothetical protein
MGFSTKKIISMNYMSVLDEGYSRKHVVHTIASCVQRTPLSVAMVVIMTFIVTDAGSKKFLSANHFSFS